MTDLNHAAFILGIIGQCYANDLRGEMANNDPELVAWITKAIEPVLRGFAPEIQGAVLADLTATWLAGHFGPDADQLREQMLQNFIGLIRELIPVNEQRLLERLKTAGNA